MSFAKRIASTYSRALLESDSEDDESPPLSPPTVSFLDANDKPIELAQLLQFDFKNTFIASGPVASAYFINTFELDMTQSYKGSVIFSTIKYDGTSSTETDRLEIHLNKQRDIVLLLKHHKHKLCYNYRLVTQLLVNQISTCSQSTQVIILCSKALSSHQSFNLHETSVNTPLFRCLKTSNFKSSDTLLLEPPNIATGISAEFLNSFHIRSIKTCLFIIFHSTSESPVCAWASVKEIFASLSTASLFPNVGYNESLIDENLKQACNKTVCGDKPFKMDQMYT